MSCGTINPIPRCPMREEGSFCCRKPDGTLDCEPPLDASVPADQSVPLPDLPQPDMCAEPQDICTPDHPDLAMGDGGAHEDTGVHDDGGTDGSADADMCIGPDLTVPPDLTQQPDLSDLHNIPVNTDLLLCAFTDDKAKNPVKDFNAALTTENSSYYATVEPWKNVLPNGCVRLCNATNKFILPNPPCKGSKCTNEPAPLGLILSLAWQVKLPPGSYIRDVKTDLNLKVAELTVSSSPIPGSDGGINYSPGLLVTVPSFDLQKCSCYYYFNATVCP